MLFSTSKKMFRLIESHDMTGLYHELSTCATTEKLAKEFSALIHHQNTIKSYNLLEASCLVGNLEALTLLLSTTKAWNTNHIHNAAHLAAHLSDFSLIDQLIHFGCHPNIALLKACIADNHALIIHILKNYKEKIDISDPEPVFRATHSGRVCTLETLDNNGFNLHEKKDEALILAVRRGHIEAVHYLISKNANVNTQGALALKEAIINGNFTIVNALLNAGADIQQIADEYFIALAERYHQVEIVNLLRTKMAELHATAPININQSIHISSVDQSASKSALRLQSRYEKIITSEYIEKTSDAMLHWLTTLTESAVTLTAQRALIGLLNSEDIHSKTGISLKYLLLLTWTAILDDKVRIGTLNDAKNMLIEGLYEIQRGYNLLPTGVDIGGIDEDICVDGKANKLLEKLIGIHPDVQISVLTKEIASLKLRAITRQEALECISSKSALSSTGFFSHPFNLDSLWPEIREKIKNKIYDEFSALFKSYDDPELDQFIDMGVYTNLDDKRELLLESSPL